MSTKYSVAGPDIGVQAVDFAGLVEQLGDEAAMEMLTPIKDGMFHRVPGKDPIRIVRQHKQGDETLGFEYFARKAGVTPAECVIIPREEEAPARSRRAPPIEGEHFGMSAQHLLDQRSEGIGGEIHAAVAHFTITVPVGFYVRTHEDGQIGEILRRYMAGESFEPGTGILMEPLQVLATAATRIEKARTVEQAGWKAELLNSEKLPPEDEKAIINRLVANELREYQSSVRSNVDLLASFLER